MIGRSGGRGTGEEMRRNERRVVGGECKGIGRGIASAEQCNGIQALSRYERLSSSSRYSRYCRPTRPLCRPPLSSSRAEQQQKQVRDLLPARVRSCRP